MLGSRFSPFQWRYAGALVSVALCGTLWGQAPYYTSASIVNAADYSPGPFAPASVLSLFGTNLAWTTEAVSPQTLAGGSLPTQLAAVIVCVDSVPVPLLYASPTQINFLVPSSQIPGDVTVTVVRQGVHGPLTTITLVDAAPALFVLEGGFAIAQDWNTNYTLMTSGAPAHAGDIAVLYATGLGHTNPPWPSGVVAQSAAFESANEQHHSQDHCCTLCHVGPLQFLEASASAAVAPIFEVVWLTPAAETAADGVHIDLFPGA